MFETTVPAATPLTSQRFGKSYKWTTETCRVLR